LKACDILGGSVKIGDGPKLVTHDFLTIPAEGLNEGEASLGMGAPSAMNDSISLSSGVIDPVKQLKDNFLGRVVFDLNLGESA